MLELELLSLKTDGGWSIWQGYAWQTFRGIRMSTIESDHSQKDTFRDYVILERKISNSFRKGREG